MPIKMEDVEKKPATAETPQILSHNEGVSRSALKISNGKHGDIGFELFEQSHQYDYAQLEIDAVKVRRKLDFILLPMVRLLILSSIPLWCAIDI